MQSLLEKAEKYKVNLLPAANFATHRPAPAAFRLGFGNLDLEEIHEGVMRLKLALEANHSPD